MKLLACTLAFTFCSLQPVSTTPASLRPEVRHPRDGADIEAAQITAKGWAPSGRAPFFVVAPNLAAPRMWVQPPIAMVRSDGTFSGLVHLGKGKKGIGEQFTIYVFACASADRFKDGEILMAMPTDCEISDPVEVSRIR